MFGARLRKLEQWWRLYRWWLMPWHWWRYRRWVTQQHCALPKGPLVVFDFTNARVDGPQGRRFYALFIVFQRAGYYPVFIARYPFLVTIHSKIKKLCLQEPFSVCAGLSEIVQPFIRVSDRYDADAGPQCQRQLLMDYRFDYLLDRQGFPLPFPMFPGIYATGADRQLDTLRQGERPWAVFFGGSFRAERYSMSAISEVYKKLPRALALAALQNGLGERYVEPRSEESWEQQSARGQDGVLVLNTGHVSVSPATWLGLIAKGRFFLALPGVSYPMSHNLVEALAVGSVPITEYPELFFPALEDGVNCLTFRGEDGLLETVKRAMSMPKEDAQRLSLAAMAYYDTYLAPKAVIANLLAVEGDPVCVRQTPFILSGGRDV